MKTSQKKILTITLWGRCYPDITEDDTEALIWKQLFELIGLHFSLSLSVLSQQLALISAPRLKPYPWFTSRGFNRSSCRFFQLLAKALRHFWWWCFRVCHKMDLRRTFTWAPSLLPSGFLKNCPHMSHIRILSHVGYFLKYIFLIIG